jgi:hypothetical protein
LFGISPQAGRKIDIENWSETASGAFVNAFTFSKSGSKHIDKVKRALDDLGFDIQSYENISPLTSWFSGDEEHDTYLIDLAGELRTESVVFDAFYIYAQGKTSLDILEEAIPDMDIGCGGKKIFLMALQSNLAECNYGVRTLKMESRQRAP